MTVESNIEALEKALMGATDDEEKQHAMRMAVVKQAASDMNDEEKKEAKGYFAMDDEEKEKKGKKGQDEDEDEEKDGKKGNDDEDEEKEGKKGNDEDMEKMKKAMEEKDKEIKSLGASLSYLTAKPTIDKMVQARMQRGMSAKDLKAFEKSLYGKSITEIKQRYDEDQALFGSNKPVVTVPDAVPFNGSLEASDDDQTLEAMFE